CEECEKWNDGAQPGNFFQCFHFFHLGFPWSITGEHARQLAEYRAFRQMAMRSGLRWRFSCPSLPYYLTTFSPAPLLATCSTGSARSAAQVHCSRASEANLPYLFTVRSMSLWPIQALTVEIGIPRERQ